MGWDVYSDPKMRRKQIIKRQTDSATWGSRYKVLMSSAVGNHLWQAMERITDEGATVRFIALTLMRGYGRDSGWGFKVVSEQEGLLEVDCPLGILKLVPETEDGAIPEWRQAVRDWHARQNELAKARRALTRGDVIKYGSELFELEFPLYSERGKRVVAWAVARRRDGAKFKLMLAQITTAIEQAREAAKPSDAPAPAPNPQQLGLLGEAA